jgi:hypothetical protein
MANARLDYELLTLENSWRELERIERFVGEVGGGVEDTWPGSLTKKSSNIFTISLIEWVAIEEPMSTRFIAVLVVDVELDGGLQSRDG